MKAIYEDQDLMTPYAAPGTDAARIRALELRIKWLAEEVADVRGQLRRLEETPSTSR